MAECDKYQKMMDLYLDDMLTKEQKNELLCHIEECEICKKEFGFMQEVKECLNSAEELPLPENFSAQLHQRLEEEISTPEEKAKTFYRNWRTYSSIAAVVIFAFIIKSGLADNKPSPKLSNEYEYSISQGNDANIPMAASESRMLKGVAPENNAYEFSESVMVLLVDEKDLTVTQELLGEEKHTKASVERLLKEKNISWAWETEGEEDGIYTILIKVK